MARLSKCLVTVVPPTHRVRISKRKSQMSSELFGTFRSIGWVWFGCTLWPLVYSGSLNPVPYTQWKEPSSADGICLFLLDSPTLCSPLQCISTLYNILYIQCVYALCRKLWVHAEPHCLGWELAGPEVIEGTSERSANKLTKEGRIYSK